ncbi:DUF3179 domain-containing protein [Maribacter algarum]|uniref:DUF3179 domain-containing protein n=1 Tax=Maribacter algarum (ex Zhang et al. 2020) TaxID=2578118 RepID=A0A5S3PXB0_9FLAO|nr:DUF3179 domain-containing protein [Maribacter algarum]TMM59500.1 DUF3179 domain-containing protein [Maribacter algarum]
MKKNIFLFAFLTILFSCSKSTTQDSPQNPDSVEIENTSTEWSIPVAEVLDGGPGRDGIPALENPQMVTAANSSILFDTDLILGYKNGDDIRAYQHIVLDWHEIVNDNIGDVSLAISYCPLTGTGIGWNRIIDGKETTFGVSGLLYQTNLIPFDRATKSNWSQILNESVNGSLEGKKAELIQLVETDWKTWKTMYPTTTLINLNNTGFSRTYGVYPYGDYRTSDSRFFFPTPKDPRLPLKERVHTIIDDGDAKTYRFSNFETTNTIKDSFKGKNYLIVGNANFITSFELDANQNSLEYEYVFDNSSDVIVQDSEGTQWNVFGEAISGPGQGQKLVASKSFMGYWFSIPAFYTTEIYNSN